MSRGHALPIGISVVTANIAVTCIAGAQSLDRTWRVTDKSGTAVQVRQYQETKPDCTTAAIPNIAIDHPPAHGSVTTQIESVKVDPLRARRCIGAKLTGVAVVYTSNAGFRGEDNFSYTVTFSADSRRFHDTAIVTVR